MSAKKPLLAVDLDEVIFPFTREYVRYFNSDHGTHYSLDDLETYYYVEQLHGIDDMDVIEDMIHKFHARAVRDKILPYSGAVDALQKLSSAYEIVIITARHPAVQELTHTWIQEHLGELASEVHFAHETADQQTKADICHKLGVSVMIDDMVKHFRGCPEVGVRCLLFGNMPWTKADEATMPVGIERVENWKEVLEVLL